VLFSACYSPGKIRLPFEPRCSNRTFDQDQKGASYSPLSAAFEMMSVWSSVTGYLSRTANARELKAKIRSSGMSQNMQFDCRAFMLSRITRKSMSSRAPLIGVTFEAQSLKIGYVIIAAALSRQDVINFDSPLIR
jgi:hypothetical protein